MERKSKTEKEINISGFELLAFGLHCFTPVYQLISLRACMHQEETINRAVCNCYEGLHFPFTLPSHFYGFVVVGSI